MKKHPKVSIIIPLYVIEPRFFEDLKKFKLLDYTNYEILVVCDQKVNLKIPKTRLILTKNKKTGPAEKRDLALKQAKGEICAFIDDDAYPDKNWLKNAVRLLNNSKIMAVGGPGITPKEDNYWQQVTGLIYQSYFCGGPTQHRFTKAARQFVVDYPAYNLLVKTNALKEVGGYGSYFYGGEDTFLCLKITQKGWKILYDPEVVVFHHRRPLLFPYLKQIANVGKHRGYFARVFPKTSRHFYYFVPSLLALGLLVGLLSLFFSQNLVRIYFLSLLFFLIVAFASIIRKSSIDKAAIATISIILTHITYGLFFLKGFFTKELKH